MHLVERGHHQTYQNYEQTQQKLRTMLENKVLQKSKFSNKFISKSWTLSLIFFTEKNKKIRQIFRAENDLENQILDDALI